MRRGRKNTKIVGFIFTFFAILMAAGTPEIVFAELYCFEGTLVGYAAKTTCFESTDGLTGNAMNGACKGRSGLMESVQNCRVASAAEKEKYGDSRYSGVTGAVNAIGDLLTFLHDIFLWVVSLPLMISSLYLYVAGTLFDSSLAFTISNFSANYAAYFSSGVDQVWGSFRDVGNIVMIGVFVYIAFRTMLGMESFGMKSFAARLVIVALLINFSLFFTKVIVDISNITAIQFVRATGTAIGSSSGLLGTGAGAQTNVTSIANVFSDRAGIKGSLTSGAKEVVKSLSGGSFIPSGDALLYVLLVTIFFLAVASVLLHGAILLITRMIVLVFLMVTSSFAWVAFMTPKLNKYWDMWWDHLIKYALFAPLYMLFIWASIQLTRNLAAPGGGKDAETLVDLTKSSSMYEAMIKVAFIVGLLYISTTVAENLSIKGAKFAKSVSLRGLGFAASPFTAGASALGRLTNKPFGWAQSKHADMMASDSRATRALANTLLGGVKMNKALENLSKSQFQLRDAKFMKGAFGKSDTDEDRAKIIAKRLKDEAKKPVEDSNAKLEEQAKAIRDKAANEQASSSAGGGADAKIAETAGKAAGQAAGEAVKDARVTASEPRGSAPKPNIMEQMARGAVPPSKDAQAKAGAGTGETAREGRKIEDVASAIAQKTAEAQARQQAGKMSAKEEAQQRISNIVSDVLKSSKERDALGELQSKQDREKNLDGAITQVAQARAATRFSGSLKDAILKELGGKSGLGGAFGEIQKAIEDAKKGGGDGGKVDTKAIEEGLAGVQKSVEGVGADVKKGTEINRKGFINNKPTDH